MFNRDLHKCLLLKIFIKLVTIVTTFFMSQNSTVKTVTKKGG